MINPTANRILARLTESEQAELASRFERITVRRETLIAEPGTALDFAYFPLDCVLSSLIVFEDGGTVEAATAGNEGMVYPGLLSRPNPVPYRIVTQIAGESLRIPVPELDRSLQEIPSLRTLLDRYVLTLLHLTSQNAACNLRHSVVQRMARWLLLCADRSGKDRFDLTQTFLALMLGVRRQSVNVTAGLLHDKGFIEYRRGGVTVLDRPGLTATACECYRAIVNQYDETMRIQDHQSHSTHSSA